MQQPTFFAAQCVLTEVQQSSDERFAVGLFQPETSNEGGDVLTMAAAAAHSNTYRVLLRLSDTITVDALAACVGKTYPLCGANIPVEYLTDGKRATVFNEDFSKEWSSLRWAELLPPSMLTDERKQNVIASVKARLVRQLEGGKMHVEKPQATTAAASPF